MNSNLLGKPLSDSIDPSGDGSFEELFCSLSDLLGNSLQYSLCQLLDNSLRGSIIKSLQNSLQNSLRGLLWESLQDSLWESPGNSLHVLLDGELHEYLSEGLIL